MNNKVHNILTVCDINNIRQDGFNFNDIIFYYTNHIAEINKIESKLKGFTIRKLLIAMLTQLKNVDIRTMVIDHYRDVNYDINELGKQEIRCIYFDVNEDKFGLENIVTVHISFVPEKEYQYDSLGMQVREHWYTVL